MAFCAAIPTRQILASIPSRRGVYAWGWIVGTVVVLALNLSTVRANPAGGSVSHGNATIDQNGNTLTIHQGTDLLIMGWHSFSIGQGETTRFVQPSSSSMALNRVYGGTRSMIEGRLEANGGVILINPAGITVTKSGVVNVNTFIGSTHDITDDEFLKGGALNFKGTSEASIENLGTIHAETGDIALIAHKVRNEGTLSAPKGVVGLAAGDEVLYQPNADERLLVKSQTATAASIHHSGSIQAAAAEIKAAGNPYAVAINLDGIVEARGNAARNTKPRVIVHAAQGDVKVGSTAAISASDESGGGLVKIRAATGNLRLDGKMAANSSTGNGGEIQILGNNITLSGTALLDASGATGGGKIFVGGDYQGGANPAKNYASEPLQNASTLRIDKGAIMNADATLKGDGGVVINWADGTTVSLGSVSVRGGPLGGNGGFVEISGKRNLGFDGTVDLAAPRGKGGQVLFDPNNIQITSGDSSLDWNTYLEGTPPTVEFGSFEGSQNMSQTVLTGVTSGTITLKANNISLEDGSGQNPATITLQKNVSLVLESQNDRIYLPSGSSITASGTGYVKLDASQSSQLVIHGDITTAAGAITLIAQNNIDLIGSSLKTTGGNVSVTSLQGIISSWGSINEPSIISGGGSITMNGSSVVLTGTTIASGGGNINLTASKGWIGLYEQGYESSDPIVTATTIESGGGAIQLNAQTDIHLIGSSISSTTGSITLGASKDISLWSQWYPSSITTETGAITLMAAQDLNFVGNISSANGGVTLESYYGNLNLSPGSSITQSGNSGITLIADNGSILGSSALSTPSGWVRLQAPNNNGSIIENHLVGSVDFSGPINAGSWIDIGAGNEITLNGAVSSSSSSINIHANNAITLGNLDAKLELNTSLNALYDVNLSVPFISLNGTTVTSTAGNIWINTGSQLTLSSDTLATITSTKSGGIFNNLSAYGIYLQANNVTLSDQPIKLPSNENLWIYANSGNLTIPSVSSITASGSGWVNLIAYKDFNFGGTISSVNGGVTLESYYGNLNLSPGSSITQSGNSGITLLADNGSILGSSALSTPSGWVRLQAPNNNGTMTGEYTVGSVDFSGPINAGYWIDIYGGNQITLNGAVSSSSSTVNLRANSVITLGNLDASSEGITTSLTSSSDIYLTAPSILLNGTPVTSGGSIWLNTGSQLTLSSDTLATITSTKSGGIFNNLSAQGIYLQANNVTLSDQPIKLPSNENLWIYANSGNLTIPSVSSITASGNGWVNLIAYKDFNFGGTISSVNGGVTLESYYGNLNLSPGSSITQSGNSGITLLADNGSILGSSALSTPSGWVRLQAQNNNGTMIGGYTVGSVDFSGPINAGYWIDIYGGNEITLNGAVSSSSSTVNLRANNSITLGSTPPLSPKSKISTAIVGIVPTTISASGSLYLNAPVLSFINTPVLSAGALSGSLGSINSSSVQLASSTPLTKGYDGTAAINLLPTDLLISGLIEGYTAVVVSANGSFNSPNVQSAIAVAINTLVLQLTEPKTTSGDFSLNINNISLAGSITPATLTASLAGSVSRIYDGTTAAALTSANYSLSPAFGKDTVNLNNPASGTYENANAGTGKTVSVTGLSLDNANYQLESTTINGAIGAITPKTLSATLSGGVSKVYDGNNTATVDPSLISLSGIVVGKKFRDDVSINSTFTSTYDTANVGIDKTVSVSGLTLTGAMAGNYTLAATLTGSGEITPKTLSAMLSGGVSKVYDGNNTATVDPSLISLSGIVVGKKFRDDVSINSTFTSTYDTANVGIDKTVSVSGLTLTGAMAGNYTLAATLTGSGEITPATLTATLSGGASKVYDGTTAAALTSINYLLNGVIGKDTVSLNNPSSGTYDNANAGTGKTVSVTGLSLDNANYQLESTTINGAIGAITPATLTATLSGGVSKQYNGDTIAKISPVNYILNGTIYGKDTANLVLNNPVTGSYDTANAGSGINVTVSGLVLTGSAANNYQLASTTINAPIGTITALPPPPAGNGNSLTITGVISTPSFMRMVQAAVPPPPPPAPAGPAGPAGGGSFGSAGPSSGGGGFSQSAGEAVAGGPASAPPPQEGSGQSGDGASDPNSPPPAPGSGPVADNGSAPAANGAPVAANGSAAGGAAAAGGSTSTGAAAGGASHAGGTAGSSSGSGSPGQAPAHLPASVVAATRLNSPVSAGNSATAAFNRLNPTISAGEGLSEGSSSSSGEGSPSQGAAQVNQSRATRFGGIGSDSTPGGDLNSMVQILAL